MNLLTREEALLLGLVLVLAWTHYTAFLAGRLMGIEEMKAQFCQLIDKLLGIK